ncbi:MAG TPA: response regulator, partial [Kofleriaceae bacterium]
MGQILVVDDERSMREFLAICLRRAGHTVTAAETVPTALAKLRDHAFDVVVTDLRMSGERDGLSILEAVKSGQVRRGDTIDP